MLENENILNKELERRRQNRGNFSLLDVKGEGLLKTLKELALFSKFRKIKQMDMFGSDVRRHHRITSRRSKVEELVVAENVVLALTRTGLCVAFDRDTKKLLTTLNASNHGLVRSIFHNRSLSSVIIVSVSEHDNFAALVQGRSNWKTSDPKTCVKTPRRLLLVVVSLQRKLFDGLHATLGRNVLPLTFVL